MSLDLLEQLPVDGWELKNEWRRKEPESEEVIPWWQVIDPYIGINDDDVIAQGPNLVDVLVAAKDVFQKRKAEGCGHYEHRYDEAGICQDCHRTNPEERGTPTVLESPGGHRVNVYDDGYIQFGDEMTDEEKQSIYELSHLSLETLGGHAHAKDVFKHMGWKEVDGGEGN